MAKEILGHLLEFSLTTSDWSIFKARLENYFLANGITDDRGERRRAILLNVLDEDAYKLMFDLVSPMKPEEKTYEQLTAEFNKHFQPQQTVFAARYKFYAAKKEVEESAQEWAARLRGLAVSCQFDAELTVCLRDKYIFGFNKGPVLDRLMEEKPTVSFEKIVSLAASKIASIEAQEITVKLERERDTLHHVRSDSRRNVDHRARHHQSGGASNKDGGGAVAVGCQVCGRHNHNKDKCYFRNSICLVCNKNSYLCA